MNSFNLFMKAPQRALQTRGQQHDAVTSVNGAHRCAEFSPPSRQVALVCRLRSSRAPAPAFATEELNALVWCDHTDPALVEPFEKANDVKVNLKDYEGTGAALSILDQSPSGRLGRPRHRRRRCAPRRRSRSARRNARRQALPTARPLPRSPDGGQRHQGRQDLCRHGKVRLQHHLLRQVPRSIRRTCRISR